jgi:hypothetical protein
MTGAIDRDIKIVVSVDIISCRVELASGLWPGLLVLLLLPECLCQPIPDALTLLV